MNKESLIKIRDGLNEIQKECRLHSYCRTCFFYNKRCSLIELLINYNLETVGKNFSLQYGKFMQ